jgi:phosphatidylinositol glycan class M
VSTSNVGMLLHFCVSFTRLAQTSCFCCYCSLFLVFTVGTVGALTHAAVHFHGREALEEGLLYHFQRVDHRHNYSMYWYWIYLARGRSYANANELSAVASPSSSIWGHLPLIPQVLILGFSSLGIAPYDLTFALFCQTFAFVAFNKVMTAQYFTWYLCLLPLCSDRIKWNSRRMAFSLGLLAISIIAWLLSAFSLEMLGWRSHRQVWLASLFFFVANVNLLTSILDGYKHEQIARAKTRPGEGWSKPKAKVT